MSDNTESTPTASQVLRSLAASMEDTVAVGALMSAVGSRAHGIALIVFALPDAVPLPIPSLSTVLGVPLVLIAAHLVLFGEDAGLPDRILATAIPTSALRVGVRYVAPVLEAMELATRPAPWPRLCA
ncbi:MAG: exopolysaccharide biosynthesis protein, partial [Propylenella sp.]